MVILTIGDIGLYPTIFFSLQTRRLVTLNNWTEIPIPENVVNILQMYTLVLKFFWDIIWWHTHQYCTQ